MKKLLISSLLLGFVFGIASAQKLVSATDNGRLKAKEVQAKYKKFFANTNSPAIKPVDIQLIKVRYLQGQDREPNQVLSGLLAVPINGAPKGIVIYYHGTLANRENVPSRYRGEEKNAETAGPVLAFATSGYAVMMPDYPGLGDGKGIHPYYNMHVNARSGLDMLDPAWFSAEKFKLEMGTNYFISGYSQGGAVAMCATQQMELAADESMRTVRSAPLSGPYDLSGTQARLMFEKDRNPAIVGARAFLASYLVRSMKHNGEKVRYENCFVPSFANYIDRVFGQNLSDENTVKKLFGKALQLGSARSIDRIVQPKFKRALLSGDRTHPVVNALVAQDCFDWKPGTEMYMVCVEGDKIVSAQNTRKAIKAFRGHSVGPDVVRHYSIKNPKLTHLTVMPPALILARRFFDGGFGAVPSSPDPK